MTDYELHREEWIAERTAILIHEAGYSEEAAERMALQFWAVEELFKRAPEPINDLD